MSENNENDDEKKDVDSQETISSPGEEESLMFRTPGDDEIFDRKDSGAKDEHPSHMFSGLSQIIGSNVYYERLPMLEVVFERLIRLSTASLRRFTGDNVEISLENITSIRFGEYLESISAPAMVNVFIVEEWDNNGLVTIDKDLIYTMVDVLLGGRTGNAPMRFDERYFTQIEFNLIEKLVYLFLADLSAAFDPLCPVTIRLDRLETNPRFATISHPTNVCILVRISVTTENRGGSIELLIPYATLEPIREILLQNYMGEKFGRDSIWESHLVNQLLQTDFSLSAILDEIAIPLSDVLDWKVGSQLPLNMTPSSPVKLVCENKPLFTGFMGRRSGNIAVKIDNAINVMES